MAKEGLSGSERIYLDTCLRGRESKLDVKWSHFYKAGLNQAQIQHFTKKFRKKGFIRKDNYNINEEKLEKIKELLKEDVGKVKKIQELQDGWRKMNLVSILLILMILSFFILLIFFQQQDTDIESAYVCNTSEENCIPSNESIDTNRTSLTGEGGLLENYNISHYVVNQ